jgi:hypothetical protein
MPAVTQVLCPNCDTIIGRYYSGTWGYWGGDPPEYDGIEDWFDEINEQYFCSGDCLEEWRSHGGC